MSKKEKVIKNLKLFNYDFIEKDNQLIVKLDFKINVIIVFQNDFVVIKNELIPWNLLSGVFKTSINQFLIVANISTLFLFFSIYFFELFGVELYLFTLAGIMIFYFMLTITSIFYMIKYEFFRNQLINWLSD